MELTFSRTGVALIFLLFISTFSHSALAKVSVEDNEFAEFDSIDDEEFDSMVEEEGVPGDLPSEAGDPKIRQSDPNEPMDDEFDDGVTVEDDIADDDAIVETEEDFDPFADDEEFEHSEATDSFPSHQKAKGAPNEKLRFAKVPPSKYRWQAYYLEIMMAAGIIVYLLNFIVGKSRNSTLAEAWFKANKELFVQNFAVVGDDGSGDDFTSDVLVRESDSSFLLWCTGRVGVQGMLCSLKLIKRQDLISTLGRIARPASDQLIVQITMEDTDMDNFVFALAQKKTSGKLHKDMPDLSLYCPERKVPSKNLGVPDGFMIMSEIGEATQAIIDGRLKEALKTFEGAVDYIHISDQYTGAKPADDSESKPVETAKTLVFCFNLGKKGITTTVDMENTHKLMKMVLYTVEKVKKFRLSKEARLKSEKNRSRAQSAHSKQVHQQRQEAAQARKEEKLRAEKERYMNEEDPEKAQKLKEKFTSKTEKKKQSKGKVIKMKMS